MKKRTLLQKASGTLLAALLGGIVVLGAQRAHGAPVSGQGTWETTLKARDLAGNAVALNDGSAAFFYDKVLNITWLSDWNVNGRTTWGNAMTWAESLSIGGYSDWRLPTMTDLGRNVGCDYANFGTDCGYNVETRTSELANMFYNTLGNLAVFDTSGSFQAGSGLNNTAYFKGIQLNAYWFGVEYAPSPSNAWIFVTNGGSQYYYDKDTALYAVAVRTGDVLAAQRIPEPGTLALLLSALVLGAVLRRRRAR